MYYDISEIIESDDFFIVRNRWIWQAFQRLQEKRARIDYLTVIEELQQRDQLREIGGAAYLTALLNQTPSSMHAVEYGRIVEDYAIRRRMLTAANEIAKLAVRPRARSQDRSGRSRETYLWHQASAIPGMTLNISKM